MRFVVPLLALFTATQVLLADDLPVTRRLLVLTQSFLDRATVQTAPTLVPGDKSRVLALFRLAESGAVIDWRASGGTTEARDSAIAALKTWRFQPTLLNGTPVQMQSGVVFDFSAAPVGSEAPSPMTAEQISPVLSTRCSLAIVKDDSEKIRVCKRESAAVDKNRAHTALESFTAHRELGLALLIEGNPRKALVEFDRAIETSPVELLPSDGEWGKLHWHRAVAQQQLGRTAEARHDFQVAEKSFLEAANATGIEDYRQLMSEVGKQLASLPAGPD